MFREDPCEEVIFIQRSTMIPGEGNGNPLQYSYLENPTDGGAWYPWGRKESNTTDFTFFPGSYA